MSVAERVRIARAYGRGLSKREVGKIHGRSASTVARHLERADVETRESTPVADVDEVVRLYNDEELSIREIARKLGVSYGTIHRIASTHADIRPRGGDSRGSPGRPQGRDVSTTGDGPGEAAEGAS